MDHQIFDDLVWRNEWRGERDRLSSLSHLQLLGECDSRGLDQPFTDPDTDYLVEKLMFDKIAERLLPEDYIRAGSLHGIDYYFTTYGESWSANCWVNSKRHNKILDVSDCVDMNAVPEALHNAATKMISGIVGLPIE